MLLVQMDDDVESFAPSERGSFALATRGSAALHPGLSSVTASR
jgi:hypothetical protein